MPRKISFTDELVRASPFEHDGDNIIYKTPFGLVKESRNGMLALRSQDTWIPLENRHGQLLVVHGKVSSGLMSITVYDSSWDYIQDKFKAYWWILPLLLVAAGALSTLNIPRFWMSGIFIVTTSAIFYREHEETGVRRAVISLLLGVISFIAISFLMEFMYSILHGLQVAMGLCDWTECDSLHIISKSDDPYLQGGRGRYGL